MASDGEMAAVSRMLDYDNFVSPSPISNQIIFYTSLIC